MNCDQVIRGEIAEKYMLNQLSEAEREAYEKHYFECSGCFEELKSYRTLQAELARTAPRIRQESAVSRGLWRWALAGVAAVVLLTVGIGLRLRHPMPGALPSTTTSATRPPQALQQAAPATPSLSDLANIQAPPYTPATLRGPTDEATLRFHEAMRYYVKRDYKGAVKSLHAASRVDPRATNIRFFLAACYLLTDQTDAAIEEFRQVIRLGDSPYLELAHFYLAKAYLRKGDLGTAQDELGRTVQLHGDLEAQAAELLQQLQTLAPHR